MRDAGLSNSDIKEDILVGGSSRTPAVQKKVEEMLTSFDSFIGVIRIEAALTELKAAHAAAASARDHSGANVQQIDQAMAKINAAWQAASEDMYKAQQQAGGANPGAGFDPNNMGGNPGAGAGQQGSNGDDNVTDVDYEEVK